MLNKNEIYEKYMKRCLSIARKGQGKTSPNPMVGAVLLDKNLNFIAEGYHKKCGKEHAEVNAINSALSKHANLQGSTIIVSLEPCSHYGKTPPCADLIIKSGIKTVIVGCLDPNPKVAGNGIKKCKEAGLEVISGILESECQKLNEIFFKNQTKKLPFVTIKTATTLDGKIATSTGSSKWITGEKARNDVQKLRNEYDAILTSSNTVIADNPSLTCRLKNGKNPIRIVVDSQLKTPADLKVYTNDSTQVIIVTTASETKNYPAHINFIKTKSKNGHVDLEEMLVHLYKMGICSILVEAGGELNYAFIKDALADKLIKYTAPKILGDNKGKSFVQGLPIYDINNSIELKFETIKKLGEDIRTDYTF